MLKFAASVEHFEALRKALRHLTRRAKGRRALTPGRFLKEVHAHYEGESNAALSSKGVSLPSRSTLEHFIEGRQQTLDSRHAANLWDAIRVMYPRGLNVYGLYSEADLVFSLYSMFGGSPDKIGLLARKLEGTYQLYHFSERFHQYSTGSSQAVVLARMQITLRGEVVFAEEWQAYDGGLGPAAGSEHSTGFCLQKHRAVMVILKVDGPSEPKSYIFEPVIETSGGIQRVIVLRGTMIHIIEAKGMFRSGVYAKRVESPELAKTEIVDCSQIDSFILDELKGLTSRVTF